MRADGLIISLAPAFLEAYYFRRRCCGGDAPADLVKPFSTEGGYVFEAPAVEREDVDCLRVFGRVGHGMGSRR